MAGPIGWGVAGATLLTSIVLFTNKKVKLSKQKKEEIETVFENTEKLKAADVQIKALLDKTETLRDSVNVKYNDCLASYGKNYLALAEENQVKLGTLVNIAKLLAATLGKGVEI
jgi:predicted phage gp36 major capsid-like protein